MPASTFRSTLPGVGPDHRRPSPTPDAPIVVRVRPGDLSRRPFDATTTDLDPAGIFVASHITLPVGTTVDVELRIPRSDPFPLRCQGEVTTRIAGAGFGVRFAALANETGAQLELPALRSRSSTSVRASHRGPC